MEKTTKYDRLTVYTIFFYAGIIILSASCFAVFFIRYGDYTIAIPVSCVFLLCLAANLTPLITSLRGKKLPLNAKCALCPTRLVLTLALVVLFLIPVGDLGFIWYYLLAYSIAIFTLSGFVFLVEFLDIFFEQAFNERLGGY